MTKPVRFLILTIVTLSLASGIYMASTGSDFLEYFSGIFLGAVLVGSSLLNKKE